MPFLDDLLEHRLHDRRSHGVVGNPELNRRVGDDGRLPGSGKQRVAIAPPQFVEAL
jgi:hypothetical protein